MKLETTYPPFPRQKMQRMRLIGFLRWPFLFAAYICPLLNIFTGGKAWSVIAGARQRLRDLPRLRLQQVRLSRG